MNEGKCIVVFDQNLLQRSQEDRLAENYIGQRRLRPSNRVVGRALRLQNKHLLDDAGTTSAASNGTTSAPAPTAPIRSSIVFKVVGADGKLRRMTKKEKKEAKRIHAAKRMAEEVSSDASLHGGPNPQPNAAEGLSQADQDHGVDSAGNPRMAENSARAGGNMINCEGDDRRTTGINPTGPGALAQLSSSTTDEAAENEQHDQSIKVNWEVIKQEISELQGVRNGMPPAVLSSAMASQFQLSQMPADQGAKLRSAMVARDHPLSPLLEQASFDLDVSRRWAQKIRETIRIAEVARSKEDLRPLAYTLIPEVWCRHRPESITSHRVNPDTSPERQTEPQEQQPQQQQLNHQNDGRQTASSESAEECSNGASQRRRWMSMSMRPTDTLTAYDHDSKIVFEYLHRNSTMHISCGAKFGCDYLLYDGPRDKRHAFAGLRVLSARSIRTAGSSASCAEDELPVPTAYDLTGYVRCLNTAGKIALLAAVVKDEEGAKGSNDRRTSSFRVALVDLALEKVCSDSFDGTKKRKRKATGQKLAKG